MKSSANGAVSKAGDAVGETRGRLARFVSKARTPLLAGGAALAGVAGAAAVGRARSNGRSRKLSLPKPLRRLDPSRLDVDALTSAGRRIREIGQQIGDIADATEKTRKKHD